MWKRKWQPTPVLLPGKSHGQRKLVGHKELDTTEHMRTHTHTHTHTHSFPAGSVVKNLPAVQETWVRSLGQEDTQEKGMVTHSSILAWRFPWTEGPWDLKESDMTERLSL